MDEKEDIIRLVRGFNFEELDFMHGTVPDNITPDLKSYLEELCLAIKETIEVNFENVRKI